MASSVPTATLSDGNVIPMIGYGTGTALFKRTNVDQVCHGTIDAIKQAIRVGFRHIDGAEVYNTETEVGIAVRESGLPREEFFITTKVIVNIDDIQGAITKSLEKLQTDYVDLYLIHSPWFAKSETKDPVNDPFDHACDAAKLQAAWAEMEKVQKAGKAKSIGVSNFLPEHLEAIWTTATLKPVVNQVEFHPYLQRQNLLPWAKEHGVTIEAFGPLTPIHRAPRPGPIDDLLKTLSAKYGVSEESVALRWAIDQGVVAISTSSKESRLRDYLRVTEFRLEPSEIQALAKKGLERHFRFNSFQHTWPEEDRA